MKKIWILWGMWPQASIHFYQLLIQKVELSINDPRNQDYPYLILSNIPVPDLIQWQNNKNITINMVRNEAKRLEASWVDFLVMPCNTMHLFKDEIMKWIHIPFLSMIDCVIKRVQKLKIKRVWLLGSTTTMRSQLYISPIQNLWIQVNIPQENTHETISHIIQNYISWKISKNDIQYLESCCHELEKGWVEAIILWCTELPLILSNCFEKHNFIASSEVLATETLKYSKT